MGSCCSSTQDKEEQQRKPKKKEGNLDKDGNGNANNGQYFQANAEEDREKRACMFMLYNNNNYLWKEIVGLF